MLEVIKKQKGVALLMSVLILTSMFVVALNAADVMFSGVLMSGVQERSTLALYAAESGCERALYEARKNNNIPASDQENIFSTTTLSNNSYYTVDFASTSLNIRYTSNGIFNETARTVMIDFNQ